MHSPHLGYVSLFPLVLGHLPCDHPMAQRLIAALQPPSRGSHKVRRRARRSGKRTAFEAFAKELLFFARGRPYSGSRRQLVGSARGGVGRGGS